MSIEPEGLGPKEPQGNIDPVGKAGASCFSKWLRSAVTFVIATTLMAGAIFLGGRAYNNLNNPTVVVIPASTATAVPTPTPFAPIRLNNLQVDPKIVVVGKTAVLVNGVCNDTPEDVVVRFYLGAIQQTLNPLIGNPKVVNLAGEPISGAAGGLIRSIPPGCSPERMTGIVPDLLSAGNWKLTMNIVATNTNGDVQIIKETSDEFEVVVAQPLPPEAQ